MTVKTFAVAVGCLDRQLATLFNSVNQPEILSRPQFEMDPATEGTPVSRSKNSLAMAIFHFLKPEFRRHVRQSAWNRKSMMFICIVQWSHRFCTQMTTGQEPALAHEIGIVSFSMPAFPIEYIRRQILTFFIPTIFFQLLSTDTCSIKVVYEVTQSLASN